MRTLFIILTLTVFLLGCSSGAVTKQDIEMAAKELDFGDQKSSTLTNKAWEALEDRNFAEALAYTQRTEKLYGDEAKRMNSGLTDFPMMEQAFDYWALNDVGTSKYIAAQAYVEMDMYAEAADAYQTLHDDYRYSQCWDPKGWFWKPSWGAANKAKDLRLKSKRN